MKEVTYTVHIEPAEEGGFVASFPALPGCQTQGETFEEVIAMAKDALIGFLETLRLHGQPIPEEGPQLKQVGFEFPLRASFVQMTRLPMLSARKMIQSLARAGFVEDSQKGSHCYLLHPLKKIATCVPMHGGDLKRSLVRAILQQAGLTEDEFRKLL